MNNKLELCPRNFYNSVMVPPFSDAGTIKKPDYCK